MIKSRLLQEQKLREDDMFSWLRGKAVRGSNQSHYNQQSFSIHPVFIDEKSNLVCALPFELIRLWVSAGTIVGN